MLHLNEPMRTRRQRPEGKLTDISLRNVKLSSEAGEEIHIVCPVAGLCRSGMSRDRSPLMMESAKTHVARLC